MRREGVKGPWNTAAEGEDMPRKPLTPSRSYHARLRGLGGLLPNPPRPRWREWGAGRSPAVLGRFLIGAKRWILGLGLGVNLGIFNT